MTPKNDSGAAAENDNPTIGDTFNDLRGRQSVRATFKLSAICIDAISIVAGQLGIKQKSLFDHLFQDAASLRDIARKLKGETARSRQPRPENLCNEPQHPGLS